MKIKRSIQHYTLFFKSDDGSERKRLVTKSSMADTIIYQYEQGYKINNIRKNPVTRKWQKIKNNNKNSN